MTDQDFTKQLEGLNVPDINTPKQANLLKVNLIRHHEKTLGLLGGFRYVVQTYKQMSLFKKLSPVAAVVVVAVIFGVLNQSTPVSAQATVNKAMMRAEKLTPEQRTNIEAKIKADLSQSLEEAKVAPDLKIESGDSSTFGFHKIAEPFGKIKHAFNFEKKADGMHSAEMIGIAGSAHGGPAISGNIKQMTYTNPEGQKVTLGVDENDMVVFKMVQLTEEQKQQLMETRKQIHEEKGFKVMEGGAGKSFEFSLPPTDALTVPDQQ